MSSSERKPRNYYVDYTKRNNNRGPFSRRGPIGYGESNNVRYKQVPEFESGGNRGFIITAVDEVKCYLEMRHVLEQYFHELYDKRASESDDKKETSTEEDLEAELKHLRVSRPFKQIKTHCRNAIFLNILDNFDYVDPIALVDRFFDDLEDTRTIKTSNTCKVLPVLDTFRNNIASAKESIIKILTTKYADDKNKNYFIEIQTRGNYKLETDDKQRMVESVAEAVHEAKPDWQVSREQADYIISLTALRNICCLSILKHYFKRSKYNVIEFCKKICPELAESVKESVAKEGHDEATVIKEKEAD